MSRFNSENFFPKIHPRCGFRDKFRARMKYLNPGIQGPPGPGTDRSELVRDFQHFVGPGPLRDFSNFPGPGPIWSGISKTISVLVQAGPGFLKFSGSWSELVRDF